MEQVTTVLGKVSLTPKGTYDPAKEYERLDIILYQGCSYIVLKTFTGIPPAGDNEYTMRLTEKGDKGNPLKFSDLTDEEKFLLKGETGKGLTIQGYYISIQELTALVDNPEEGDAYGVGEQDPYDIYIYDGVTGSWKNNGPLQGAAGKSAYQSYKEGGGTLTEAEFALALAEIQNKISKQDGHGLYPDADKTKLASIAASANNYTHPNDANTRHVTDTEKATWNAKAAGDHNHNGVYQPVGSYAAATHNHDETYQPKGSYQPAGSYAAADHNHNGTYQPAGNYQPAGSYATSDHKHDGVYQPVGSYAVATHNHDEAYQPKGSYQPAGSYATADHNHNSIYQPVGNYAASDHNHDTTYVKQESGKGLSTNDFTTTEKTRLANAVVPSDVQTISSLAGMPVNKYNLIRTYTSSTPDAISFASTPAAGFECIISILNNTAADITQAIPNATGWQSEDESVDLPAGEVTEISIRYVHGKYIVRI